MSGGIRSTRRRPPSRNARSLTSGTSSVARSPREGAAPVAPRIAMAGVIGVAVIGILLLRLWALTVLNGADYAERADSNVIRKLPMVAPRGEILDSHGHVLVRNREQQQIVLDLQDVDPDRLESVIVELGRVLASSPRTIVARTVQIREAVDAHPDGAIEPVLIARDERRDYVLHYLAEHNRDFPGVDVRPTFVREYPQKTTAAHVLGYDGLVDEQELKGAYANLHAGDRVGKSGLEQRYDEYVRGTDGYDAVQVDAAGIRSDVPGLRGLPAVPGRNLVTTLDLRVQQATERAVYDNIMRARSTSKGRDSRAGAAVMLDVNSGGVIASASFPTYDPNLFNPATPKQERQLQALFTPRDSKHPPLLNQAIAGQYPPGSTFKPITAFAAFANKWATPDELIRCPAYLDVLGSRFKNHVSDDSGSQTVVEALESSCDTYFYHLALYDFPAPKPVIANWAMDFGVGVKSGIDIPGEEAGRAPTPAWKKAWAEQIGSTNPLAAKWLPGDSINMSIGQGDVLATPLQMTNVFATIANGGTVYTPHIGQRVQELDGSDALTLPHDKPRKLDLDPVALNAIRTGLEQVVSGPVGTARGVFDGFSVPSAGKTGTAEKTGQTDVAWYCGYAPIDKPKVAACAFVDGGGGGSTTAAPIVLRMFQSYFHVDGGNAGGAAGE